MYHKRYLYLSLLSNFIILSFLPSCQKEFQLVRVSPIQFNRVQDSLLREYKRELFKKARNTQILNVPIINKDEEITYFFYEGNPPHFPTQLDSLLFSPVTDSDYANLVFSGEKTEKILINSKEVVDPYTYGWYEELIDKLNQLSEGEHKIQLIGKKGLSPTSEYFNFFIFLLMNDITYAKGFKISSNYNLKGNFYATSIWLSK